MTVYSETGIPLHEAFQNTCLSRQAFWSQCSTRLIEPQLAILRG